MRVDNIFDVHSIYKGHSTTNGTVQRDIDETAGPVVRTNTAIVNVRITTRDKATIPRARVAPKDVLNVES